MLRWFLFLSMLSSLAAQSPTKVDIAGQTRNADLSGAAFVKPFRMVGAAPATCSDGEVILKMPEAAAYVCHPANTWIALTSGSGTGGAGSLSQASDFRVAYTTSTASMGANCSAATPCNAAFGSQVYSFTNAATASGLSGMTTAGTVYFFISSSGVRTLGLPGTATATVSNLALMNNVTSFPNDSLPLASCTVLNNQFTGCTDARAFLRGLNVAGTNGITVTRNPNGIVIDYAGAATAENHTFAPVMNNVSPAPGNLNVPGSYLGTSGETAVVLFSSTDANAVVTFSQALPEEWTGPVDAEVWWSLASGSGNVQWKATTACIAAGGALSYTWNTFVSSSSQAGTAGTLKKSAFSGGTALPVNGCAAGSMMRVKIARDNGVSGNAAGDAQLAAVRLKLRKSN